MSLTGNNSNSGTAGRTSIFETFHTPNFGDETFEVQPLAPPMKTYSHAVQQEAMDEEYAMDDGDDVSSVENEETTLWMSCSPGRDLTDDEVDEEWGESTSQEMDAMNEEHELENEEKSSDDGEEDDDVLPLSKLAGKQFVDREPFFSNAKHQNSNKKSKTKTDKKAVPKKRSAYSFFYHDTQNAIKSQNPAATFGEISKIVASMWDHLESDLKEVYSRRALEYNDQHKDEFLSAAKSKPKKKKKTSSSSKHKHKLFDSETPSESQDSLESSTFKDGNGSRGIKNYDGDDVDSRSSCFSGSSRSKMSKEERLEKENKPKPICNYTKCQNPAIDDPRWEYNYCSPQCVISHCKDVFKAWVANRKTAYCET